MRRERVIKKEEEKKQGDAFGTGDIDSRRRAWLAASPWYHTVKTFSSLGAANLTALSQGCLRKLPAD